MSDVIVYCQTCGKQDDACRCRDKQRIAALEAELAAREAVIVQMLDSREKLIGALEWLSVHCDGVTQTQAPPRDVYNKTFAVLKEQQALAIPNDRTALDAMLAEARRWGMLEAARICDSLEDVGNIADAIRQAAERVE